MDSLSPRPPQSPSVWPPPPTNAPFGQEESINTSGRKGDVPPEIARLKWNWGAFLLPFLWCISHRLVWGWGILVLTSALIFGGRLDGFLMLAYFGVAVYLGLMGQSLGWQNRRFEGGEAQYFAVQRKWLTWGVIGTILSVALGVLSEVAYYLAKWYSHTI